MYEQLYVQIDLLSIGIIVAVLFSEKSNFNSQRESLYFKRIALIMLSLLILDIFWIFIDSKSGLRIVNIVLNCCYLFLCSALSYEFLSFTQARIDWNRERTIFQQFIMISPLLILFFLCLTTPWTGLLFSINETDDYIRGPLIEVAYLVGISYLILGIVESFIGYFNKKSSKEKKKDCLLLVFCLVLSILGAMSQLVIFGLPATLPITSLAFLLIYLSIQSRRISTDGLTGLANRRELDRYLESVIVEGKRNSRVSLFLFDVDNFKTINDTWGHVEGDRTLTDIAKAMKIVATSYGAFLARYGGDEFAMVTEGTDNFLPYKLQNDIYSVLASEIPLRKHTFSISLSMGHSSLEPGFSQSISEFISRADEEMYLDKQRKQKATK